MNAKIVSELESAKQTIRRIQKDITIETMKNKEVETLIDVDVNRVLNRFKSVQTAFSSINNINSINVFDKLHERKRISNALRNEIIESICFIESVNEVLQSDVVNVLGNYTWSQKQNYLDTIKEHQRSSDSNIWSRFLFAVNDKDEPIFQSLIAALQLKTGKNGLTQLSGSFYKSIRLLERATQMLINESSSISNKETPLRNIESWPETMRTIQKILERAGIKDDFSKKLDTLSSMIRINKHNELDLIDGQDVKISTIGLMIIASIGNILNYRISLSLERLLYKCIKESIGLENVHYRVFKEILTEASNINNAYEFCKTLRNVGFLNKAFSGWQEDIDSPIGQAFSSAGWSLVDGKPQLVSFHQYPVGEHMLQVIRGLDLLFEFSDYSKNSSKGTVSIKKEFIKRLREKDVKALRLLKQISFLFDQRLLHTTKDYIEAINTDNIDRYDQVDEVEYEIKNILSGMFGFASFMADYQVTSKKKMPLVLAALFHDIAKGVQNEKHEIISEEIAAKLIGPLDLSKEQTSITLQQIKYHNIVNKMKLYSAENPVYGLCATIIDYPELLLLISLADRMGSNLGIIDDHIIYNCLSNIALMASQKSLQQNQIRTDLIQIEEYLLNSTRSVTPDSLRNLMVSSILRETAEYTENMGSLYGLHRSNMPQQILSDMWLTKEHNGQDMQKSVLFAHREPMEGQELSSKPKLVVYAKDYIGLATDLISYLEFHGLFPTQLNFFTGENGAVVDEIIFDSNDENKLKEFFKTLSSNKEFVCVSKEKLTDIYSVEMDTLIEKLPDRKVDVNYLALEDTQIINIEISNPADMKILRNITGVFRENKINIEFAHVEFTKTVKRESIRISTEKADMLWGKFLEVSLLNDKGELEIDKKKIDSIRKILQENFPDDAKELENIIVSNAKQNCLQLQFIVNTKKSEEVPTEVLHSIAVSLKSVK
ncbi:MAG: hypothetical protein A2Y40_02705 [Candidatus Margulisbacteria bacterium GWF2_35_9]|nr:MAG: hypothetical protein A2Y40_02705 [Candidatus Margulisbacteria bacterium GWF2_35_9]